MFNFDRNFWTEHFCKWGHPPWSVRLLFFPSIRTGQSDLTSRWYNIWCWKTQTSSIHWLSSTIFLCLLSSFVVHPPSRIPHPPSVTSPLISTLCLLLHYLMFWTIQTIYIFCEPFFLLKPLCDQTFRSGLDFIISRVKFGWFSFFTSSLARFKDW